MRASSPTGSHDYRYEESHRKGTTALREVLIINNFRSILKIQFITIVETAKISISKKFTIYKSRLETSHGFSGF